MSQGGHYFLSCVCLTVYFTLAGSSTLCPPSSFSLCQLFNFPFVAAVGNFKFWHFWKQWPDPACLPLIAHSIMFLLTRCLPHHTQYFSLISSAVTHTPQQAGEISSLSVLRKEDKYEQASLKLVHSTLHNCISYSSNYGLFFSFCKTARIVPFFWSFLQQLLHATSQVKSNFSFCNCINCDLTEM